MGVGDTAGSRGLYSQYLEVGNQGYFAKFEASQQYKAKGVPGQPELHNKKSQEKSWPGGKSL